jgi:hypothetical protein
MFISELISIDAYFQKSLFLCPLFDMKVFNSESLNRGLDIQSNGSFSSTSGGIRTCCEGISASPQCAR